VTARVVARGEARRGRPDNGRAIFAIDRDTVGAIVGGIVACATGAAGIPVLWREAAEPLPM
jgi:hypothetical protein